MYRYLLGGQQPVRSINEVMPMIGARFYTQVENCLTHNDLLENELTKVQLLLVYSPILL